MVGIEERVTVPDSAFDRGGYRCWVTSDPYPDVLREPNRIGRYT